MTDIVPLSASENGWVSEKTLMSGPERIWESVVRELLSPDYQEWLQQPEEGRAGKRFFKKAPSGDPLRLRKGRWLFTRAARQRTSPIDCTLLVRAFINDEVSPYGETVSVLKPDEYHAAERRTLKRVRAGLHTLTRYKLLEKHKGRFSLTAKGKEVKEKLFDCADFERSVKRQQQQRGDDLPAAWPGVSDVGVAAHQTYGYSGRPYTLHKK